MPIASICLIIFYLDTSSTRDKTLRIDVSLKMLKYFSDYQNSRILVFDENGYGKKDFYRSSLNHQVFERMVFVENMPLREAICLLASHYTKVIFGPSTGLLHCASGIYTNYLDENKVLPTQLPLMVVYIGQDPKGYDEWFWWGDSLAKCVILKDKGHHRVVELLTAKNQADFLKCREFSSDLLIDFIEHHREVKSIKS